MSAWHTSMSRFRMSRLVIEISSLRMFLRMLFQDLSSKMFLESVVGWLVDPEAMVDVGIMVDVEAMFWGGRAANEWWN